MSEGRIPRRGMHRGRVGSVFLEHDNGGCPIGHRSSDYRIIHERSPCQTRPGAERRLAHRPAWATCLEAHVESCGPRAPARRRLRISVPPRAFPSSRTGEGGRDASGGGSGAARVVAALGLVVVGCCLGLLWLCGRKAEGLDSASAGLLLARAVAQDLARGVGAEDFVTGSSRFDGESSVPASYRALSSREWSVIVGGLEVLSPLPLGVSLGQPALQSVNAVGVWRGGRVGR